jgi:2-hydroxy-6-oxonona-2,4-dienedioate hydrolase
VLRRDGRIVATRRRTAAAIMQIRPTPLRLAALGAVLSGSIVYRAYRRAIDASLAQVSAGSRIAGTRCGPIEYAEAGSGPAALIVHGAGGGFDQGMQFAAPLAQPGLRVIAMSRFGYLRTPLPEDASPAAQANAHAALLDALDIDRAAIVGASAGAPSAVEFAIRYPQRCTALVLVVPLAWSPQCVSGSSARSPRFSDRLLSTIIGSDFAFWFFSRFARDKLIRHVLATSPELVANASAEERARVDAIIESILPISRRHRGLSNDASIARTLRSVELRQITAPTLVISVRDDRFGTYAPARYVAQRIPGAHFVGFEIGGHVWVGHDDALLHEIDRFLARHLSAAESFEHVAAQAADDARAD